MKWIVKKLISIMLIVMVVLTGFGISKTVEAASSGETVSIVSHYDSRQAIKGTDYWDIKQGTVQPGTTGISIFITISDSSSFLKPKEGYCFEDAAITLSPAAKNYPDSTRPGYSESISSLEYNKSYRLFFEQDTVITFSFAEANVIYAYDDTNGHPEGFDWETFRPISKKLKAGDEIVIPAVAEPITTKEGKWVFTWTSDGPENNIMPDPVTTVTVTGSWKFYELYEVEYKFADASPQTYSPPNSFPKTKSYYAGDTVELSTQDYTSTEDKDKGIWEFVGWTPKMGQEVIDVVNKTFVMPQGKVTVYGSWVFYEANSKYEYVGGLNQKYYLGSNKDLKDFRIVAKDPDVVINPDMLTELVVEGNGKHYYPERDVDYVVTEGSIIHNLKAKFIEENNLQSGTYTIVAKFADKNYATVTFKVKPKLSGSEYSIPKTGIDD